MEMFGKAIWYLLSVASSFYMMAALIVLTHCICDNGIVWNQRKKWMLLILVMADEGKSLLWKEQTWFSAVICLCYLAVFVYGCKGKWIRRCLRALCVCLIAIICFYMVCEIGGYYIFPGDQMIDLSGESRNRKELAWNLIALIVFAAIYYYFLLCFFKKDIFIPFGKKENWLIIFYCCYLVSMYVMVVISSENTQGQAAIQAAMAGVLVIFSIVFPVFLFKNRLGIYYRDLKEYQENFLQAELAHFQQYKEAQKETHRFRHDIRNYLVCLNMLLEEQKTEEAEKYLKSLLHDVWELSPKAVTGDEMLDCIFSAKWSRMQQEGILFEVDGVLDGGLPWKPIDICSVFANALDNAIEACMKITEEQLREIRVSLKHTNQFYFIEMSNTVQENVDCRRLLSSTISYTSKENQHLHGFGLQNMRRTVEKYGGVLRLDCQNQRFTVCFIISR